MKKFIILSLLLASISASVKAQDLYFAPKVGFGLSNYSGSLESAFRGSVSVGAGIGLDLAAIGVEASALYQTAGSKMEIDGDDTTIKGHYISVPLVAKLYLINTLHIYAGPQFDFLIGERLKVNDDLIIKSDFLKNKTVSGVVGAGYVFPLGLGVAFNYNFGLSSATVDAFLEDAYDNIKNPKNQNMSIVLSYRF